MKRLIIFALFALLVARLLVPGVANTFAQSPISPIEYPALPHSPRESRSCTIRWRMTPM